MEDIRRVTDPGLAGLSLQDLLMELLERVRRALGADTAAVLLVEGEVLVARAARGIEEEVRRGARVPIGKGFAGRVAAGKAPLFLDKVDETTVVNPVLLEKGLRAMLGVPLMMGDGDVIGVLHVGTLGDRKFDREDAEVLRVAGDRVAAAVSAHKLAIEHDASDLLERNLMPRALPSYPGLELAARYVPAERNVGGDWYDAFVNPSGELWLVVGDVAGHGLAAAVVMGRARSTLRSYAFLGWPPDEVLRYVDKKLAHFEPGVMVTAVCAVSAPPFEEWVVSCAGHPPPVVALAGEAASLVGATADQPLGFAEDLARNRAMVRLPPGAVLVLYTDGLVERRLEPLDIGLARLVGAVSATDPDSVCNRIMQQLVGSDVPDDDIALLVARRAY